MKIVNVCGIGSICYSVTLWLHRPRIELQAPTWRRRIPVSNSNVGNWKNSPERIASKVTDVSQCAVKGNRSAVAVFMSTFFYLFHILQ